MKFKDVLEEKLKKGKFKVSVFKDNEPETNKEVEGFTDGILGVRKGTVTHLASGLVFYSEYYQKDALEFVEFISRRPDYNELAKNIKNDEKAIKKWSEVIKKYQYNNRENDPEYQKFKAEKDTELKAKQEKSEIRKSNIRSKQDSLTVEKWDKEHELKGKSFGQYFVNFDKVPGINKYDLYHIPTATLVLNFNDAKKKHPTYTKNDMLALAEELNKNYQVKSKDDTNGIKKLHDYLLSQKLISW